MHVTATIGLAANRQSTRSALVHLELLAILRFYPTNRITWHRPTPLNTVKCFPKINKTSTKALAELTTGFC